MDCISNVNFTKPIAIYGAGSGGKKVARILIDLQYKIEAFIDSNSKTWGDEIFNIKICSPNWLLQHECNIIIASVKEDEIEEKLCVEKLERNIVLKEVYIMKYFEEHIDELRLRVNQSENIEGVPQMILGSETGFGCWGVEQYTRTISEIYQEHNIPVTIITKMGGCYEEEKQKKNMVELNFDQGNYCSLIKRGVDEILHRRPCVVQDNWQGFTLVAAIIAKKICPEQVTVLSMIHNEFTRFQKIAELLEKDIDYIGAVSRDIVERIISSGRINKEKILYKESPVATILDKDRHYVIERQKPLRIAYGGRITKEQKRTHLIFPLIDKLIERNVSFRLEMAGDGDYREDFLREVNEKNWGERFSYIGLLDNKSMSDFWKEHDIYLNVSAYEGASLAMLEAMGAGCVPIVTKVSGTSEYIKNGWNGFLCHIDCVDEMVDIIEQIEAERASLLTLGTRARQTIAEKCSKEEFCNYWIEHTGILEKGIQNGIQ